MSSDEKIRQRRSASAAVLAVCLKCPCRRESTGIRQRQTAEIRRWNQVKIEISSIAIQWRKLGVNDRIDGGIAIFNQRSKLACRPIEPILVARGDVEQHVGINQYHGSILPTGDAHQMIRSNARAGGTGCLGQPKIKCLERTFLRATRLDLETLVSGDKLHFRARTKIESLAHRERNRNLAFDGDFHVKSLTTRCNTGQVPVVDI